MSRVVAALAALAVLSVPSPGAGATARVAPASLGALDVIALEICYTTIMARYYQPADPAGLLAGARSGIIAYLASRGIANAQVPLPPAHADRYRAESDIDRDVALAVARYGARVRTSELVAKTIEGELAALHDPYSVLFRPTAFKQFVGVLDGRPTAGIGAELDVDPQTHAVRVADVFPGTPAEGAGLQPGDVITAIDGAAPASDTPRVAAALRGRPGTTVRVAFARDGIAHDAVPIVRAIVVAPDVTGRALAERRRVRAAALVRRAVAAAARCGAGEAARRESHRIRSRSARERRRLS